MRASDRGRLALQVSQSFNLGRDCAGLLQPDEKGETEEKIRRTHVDLGAASHIPRLTTKTRMTLRL